ncbi:MAG: hypothetical protein M3Z04_21155 [Chloroflexota bacterium]|nr:hypothetical protein [Chloroflexota bacterium]
MSAWRTPLLVGVGTVLALRIGLGLWAAFVLAPISTADPDQRYAHGGFPLQGSGWLSPWEREDALWYEKIAVRGYGTEGSTAFFPLLPLLLGAVNAVTGNVALAGVLVGSVAAAVAFALLYRLVQAEYDAPTAGRTVAYVALFPTAFFLYAAYTESLFLALVVGAFWAARRERWLLVMGLTVLAGLTKVQGALLGLPLAVEYLQHSSWRPWRGSFAARHWATLLALAAAGAVGTAAFFAYLTWGLRDPLSWFTRESRQWQQRTTWPGETLFTALQKVAEQRQLTINTFDLVVLLGFTALTVGAFRLRISYGLYALTILATVWGHTNNTFPLMSASRFVLVAFPCFLVLAIWAGRRPRWVHLALIMFWVSWLLVWTLQSVRGNWVG